MTTERKPTMTEQLGINPSDLDARKAWNVFSGENVEVLEDLRDLATENAEEIARKFYDHSFSFPAFTAKVQEAGSNRQNLEVAQAQYFKDLFSGAYDMTYAERRLAVGSVHHRLGISPRYYIGSYIQFYEHLFPLLVEKYRKKPEQLVAAISAFLKITNFDQQLMLEAYTLGFVNEMTDQVDEVRAQATTMERNTEAILKSMEQVSEAMSQLATGATEQANNSQEAAGNVQQLGEAISTVSQASENQAKAADSMTSMIEDLKTAITQINTSVESGIQTAETASTTSEKGADVVSQTVEGMDRISASVRDGSDLIGELGAKSDEIGKIIGVIEEVADQTNLLALNAAIEAARAGEQGRGFAVVADEVRKLAERVAGATKEIAELIAVVQDGVKASVTAMDKGTEEVSTGNELVSQAGNALKEILSSVESTNAEVTEIGKASSAMDRVMAQVVELVESVATGSQEAAASSEEMTALNAQVTKMVEQVAAVAEQTSASTEQVSASIETTQQALIENNQALSGKLDGLEGTLARLSQVAA